MVNVLKFRTLPPKDCADPDQTAYEALYAANVISRQCLQDKKYWQVKLCILTCFLESVIKNCSYF